MSRVVRRLLSRVAVRAAASAALFAVASLCCVPVSAFGAEAEPCPNEAIRLEQGTTWLPDCRAYEMVTPSYHGGYEVTGSPAPDGDAMELASPGAVLAGGVETASVEDSDYYLTLRTSSGWQLSPLDPSSSELVTTEPLAFETASDMGLWIAHEPTQPPTTLGLWVRSAAGSYSYIGRLNPKEGNDEHDNLIELNLNDDEPVAATSDYSHIIFQSKSHEIGLWSEIDSTKGEGSVYEYSATNNTQPTLVAVNGPKGSTELIGECGSELGSGAQGSRYNALSSNGEEVIVTVLLTGERGCSAAAPAHDEIYARLHGAVTASAPAETVRVSASECTQECGEESGKEFEGASEDGKQIFFTSTQKLTNEAVNGTESGSATPEGESYDCTHLRSDGGCNLYEFDLGRVGGGPLKTVAGGVEVLGVLGVAESGARVYFVAAGVIARSGENAYGIKAVEGQPNLYVYNSETGRTQFVVTLSEGDERDWQRSYAGRLSQLAGQNGAFLLFQSEADVVPSEAAGVAQLYEYDAETGELIRVSQSEDGFNDNGLDVASSIYEETLPNLNAFRTKQNIGNIAENGRTVVFESKGALSPGALPAAQKNCGSVYEFRTKDRLSEGKVSLISDGRDVAPHRGARCGTTFAGMDADGENIFFITADSLLPSDVNGGQYDIYDARVDGGFAPVVAHGSCEVVGCEGAVNVAPAFSAPASLSVGADGNLAPLPSGHAKKKAKRRKPKRSMNDYCRRGSRRHKCTRASKHETSSPKAAGRHSK